MLDLQEQAVRQGIRMAINEIHVMGNQADHSQRYEEATKPFTPLGFQKFKVCSHKNIETSYDGSFCFFSLSQFKKAVV